MDATTGYGWMGRVAKLAAAALLAMMTMTASTSKVIAGEAAGGRSVAACVALAHDAARTEI